MYYLPDAVNGTSVRKVSCLPASNKRTFHFLFSLSRFAKAHPALPLPFNEENKNRNYAQLQNSLINNALSTYNNNEVI